MTESPITATVCICTQNRPEGLSRLLRSLVDQVGAPSFNVVVVDNGDGGAREVVERFKDSLDIAYDREPKPGLATTRNRTVRMATGTHLAFIDDDEDAAPTWLATMHRVMHEHEAVCVIGPVHITFDEDVSVVIQRCLWFRPVEYPEGQVMPWYHTRTSNAYMKKSALPDQQTPFDMEYNLTGGEDLEMFKSIIGSGKKIVAANAGAEVYEYRGWDRANFRWVLKRSIRNGGHSADIEWAGLSFGARFKKAWAAGRLGFRQARLAFGVRHGDQEEYLQYCIEAGGNLGRFLRLTGYLYPEYKKRS